MSFNESDTVEQMRLVHFQKGIAEPLLNMNSCRYIE